MREVLEGVFASDPQDELSPDQLLDRLLDPLVALYARGYRMLALFVALPRIGDGAQAGEPLVEEIIWRLDARLARRMPGLSVERRELSVRMIVETVRALMPLMTTAGGQVRPEAVTELKRMLRAYIAAGTTAYQFRTGYTGTAG